MIKRTVGEEIRIDLVNKKEKKEKINADYDSAIDCISSITALTENEYLNEIKKDEDLKGKAIWAIACVLSKKGGINE